MASSISPCKVREGKVTNFYRLKIRCFFFFESLKIIKKDRYIGLPLYGRGLDAHSAKF